MSRLTDEMSPVWSAFTSDLNDRASIVKRLVEVIIEDAVKSASSSGK